MAAVRGTGLAAHDPVIGGCYPPVLGGARHVAAVVCPLLRLRGLSLSVLVPEATLLAHQQVFFSEDAKMLEAIELGIRIGRLVEIILDN